MNFEPIRQAFQPLLGSESRETTSRFLYVILISVMSVDLVMVIVRLLGGATLTNSPTLRVLIILFALQCILLLAVRRGYVNQAALALVVLTWISVTYQVWSADGVRDVAIYAYIVILVIAALLTNWWISISVAS